MLILTRRVGESIMIGKDIVVTVMETQRQGARLGIEAPKSTPVDRAEIFEKKKKQFEPNNRDD